MSALARIRSRRVRRAPLPGMVPAEQISRTRADGGQDDGPRVAGATPELAARRERLLERFTAAQLELGGLFYEMAVRDHIRLDVLTPRAAELQRIDSELAQVDRLIESGGTIAGLCPACETPFAGGAGFCSSCGASLTVAGAGT